MIQGQGLHNGAGDPPTHQPQYELDHWQTKPFFIFFKGLYETRLINVIEKFILELETDLKTNKQTNLKKEWKKVVNFTSKFSVGLFTFSLGGFRQVEICEGLCHS